MVGRRIGSWRAVSLLGAGLLAAVPAAAQNVQPMGRWSEKPADPCRARPGGAGFCDGAGNWVVETGAARLVHTPAGLRRLVPPSVVSRPRGQAVESDAGRWSVVPGDPCARQPLPPDTVDSWCSEDGEWLARTRADGVFVHRRDGTTVRRFRPPPPPADDAAATRP